MFWEIIQSNKRRTVILVLAMGVVLGLLGYLLGEAIGVWSQYTIIPETPGDQSSSLGPGLKGVFFAFIFWFILLLLSFLGSDQLFLSLSGAKEVTRDKFPQLYNVVEEMKIAAAMPVLPRIFIIDDPAPNAFAVGKRPENSCICVTAGLLSLCSRDELQGVIAHEMGHITNRDVLYMTVAATMLGAVTIIADTFLRSLRFAPAARYRSSGPKGGKGGNVWIIVLAFVFVILSPLLSRLLYFCISRSREYLADATSARLTRYPEGLASALQKILLCPDRLTTAPKAIAPFYIVNPYVQELDSGFFSTHPPLPERIRILKAMDKGAAFKDYMKAYWTVTKTRKSLISSRDLKLGEEVAKRGPSPEEPAPEQGPAGNTGDIIRAMNDFVFISCPCGMKMKVPPEFTRGNIHCPRCNRDHLVKDSDLEALGAVLVASSAFSGQDQPVVVPHPSTSSVRQEVKRIPGSWQSIPCSSCGRNVQVSSAFSLNKIQCSKCGHEIHFIVEP